MDFVCLQKGDTDCASKVAEAAKQKAKESNVGDQIVAATEKAKDKPEISAASAQKTPTDQSSRMNHFSTLRIMNQSES